MTKFRSTLIRIFNPILSRLIPQPVARRLQWILPVRFSIGSLLPYSILLLLGYLTFGWQGALAGVITVELFYLTVVVEVLLRDDYESLRGLTVGATGLRFDRERHD